MADTLEVVVQPVPVEGFYKDTESNLVVYFFSLQHGIVIVPDRDWRFGQESFDWPPCDDPGEWEFFTGEIILSNPTTLEENGDVSRTDDDSHT